MSASCLLRVSGIRKPPGKSTRTPLPIASAPPLPRRPSRASSVRRPSRRPRQPLARHLHRRPTNQIRRKHPRRRTRPWRNSQDRSWARRALCGRRRGAGGVFRPEVARVAALHVTPDRAPGAFPEARQVPGDLDRPVGGLGIQIVRGLMDTFVYSRQHGSNHLLMVRRREDRPQRSRP